MTINPYESLRAIDLALNTFGYIPIISNLSGAVRLLYGKVQIIGAIAGTIFAIISVSNPVLSLASYFFVSGCMHIIRGCVEQIPIIGNWACFIYDVSRITSPLLN
jgi:hypothetical protein